MKVWIDAGHGGPDGGAVLAGSTRTEKADNLRYALELERQFRQQGWQVVLPRKLDDEAVSIADRCALEVRSCCDLALSCHRNGAAASARGMETWVHSRAPASYIAWGDAICDGIAKLGIPKRGSFRGTPPGKGYADFGVNSQTRSPSMLIELGFVSNAEDNRVFDQRLAALCAVIVRACCDFKGAPYNGAQPAEK